MNPMLFILPIIFVFMFCLLSYGDSLDRRHSEFEAKYCPEMLQVDSKYCKPIEGK